MCSSCIRSPCFGIGLAVAQVAAPDLAVLVVAPIRGGRTLWRGRLVDARAIAGARQLQGVPPPRCPLPRRRPATGGGPAALGPWDSCQDRILRPAEPGWPVRRERGRHRPVQPVLFARHPREYARSRLLDPVPIGERRARLGLGRRPRLTDLAEDVPVADQLPVVTPHFRPPGARRLGGLKGQSRPPAGRYTKMRGARPNARTDATRASSGKWDRRRPRAPPPLVTTTGAIVLVSVGKPARSAWARRRTT
jgi:hypothetical protein